MRALFLCDAIRFWLFVLFFWPFPGACFKPYKNEVQLALARGLKVKVSGRAPGDRDRLAADTVLGAALLQQGHCTEAVRR